MSKFGLAVALAAGAAYAAADAQSGPAPGVSPDYDRGFEAGAVAARDAIVDYLILTLNEPAFAQSIQDAWINGTLVPPATTTKETTDVQI